MEMIKTKHSTDFLVKMFQKYKEKDNLGLNPKVKLFSESKREDSDILEISVLIFSDDDSIVRITYDSKVNIFESCDVRDFETSCKNQP